ncbi:putative calcium-binding protein CML18 [Primulina tabacum]|uniref:putative calcium-binding protein CML18 n=1 Tax=Primulina tabacum TaxID=48773 RepID=UPI003F5A40B8
MEKAIPLTHQQLQNIFNKYDANGDGKISLHELGAILESLGSATPADEAAREMTELDSDGDGSIDFNEFKAFHCSGGGDNNKELKEAFDLYDKDKNGKISASELHTVLRSLGDKCSIKDCRRMIGSVDVDGDGCVNFDEFIRMMGRSS